jgi:succinate dehydrogenase / fumarate reductase cytochrome b subunit
MNWLTKTLTSSLGQKIIMSLTGLFLISFLMVHLTGNLLLFKEDGGAAFNAYAHFMSTALIIRATEIILVLGFALHIYIAWQLTRHNQQTRPQNYAYNRPDANSSWFSRNMGVAGSIILIFLVIHLYNFWFQYKFHTEIPLAAGTNYKDMYWLVHVVFIQEWWFSILYLIAMVFLGFHLVHGFESAFQTLGIRHKKYTPFIQKLGLLFAIVVPIGFATMPISIFINHFFYR